MKDRASSQACPEKEVSDNTFFLPGSINNLLPSFPVETPVRGASPLGSEGCPSCRAAGQGPGSETQQKTGLFPVIVPDRDLASIPGVLEDCGLIDRFSKRMILCQKDPDHDHYEVGGTSCGDPGCPRHWRTWARRGADRIGKVIWGYKRASKGRAYPRHTILSVPDDDPLVTKNEGKSDRVKLRACKKYFIKRALHLGGRGGSMVVHLWRLNDNVPSRIKDSKKWDWVRKQGELWRYFVKFSPHAHVNGFGFYKKWTTGEFLYKNMEPLLDRDAVESVAFYQLSHAPVGVGNAVVYWGCCAPNRLQIIKSPSGVKNYGVSNYLVCCSKCGSPMVYEEGGEAYFRNRSWADYEIVVVPRERKKSVKGNRVWGPGGPPVRL